VSGRRPNPARGTLYEKYEKYHRENYKEDLKTSLSLATQSPKWAIIAGYYAMYQAATSLLVKIGLQSKDHATTVAVIEHFFGKQIDKELIEKFNGLKEKKDKIESVIIDDRYIDYLWKAKGARETAQYGIFINFKETGIIMRNARDFVSKIKIMLEELDEKIIMAIHNKAKELKESIK